MWLVPPKKMCRQHLLGEHLEMHMFAGSIQKNKNILGYEKGLLKKGLIKLRHDIIVKEMLSRNYNHKTPMRKFNEGKGGFVDAKSNLKVLSKRCTSCRALQIKKFI